MHFYMIPPNMVIYIYIYIYIFHRLKSKSCDLDHQIMDEDEGGAKPKIS